VIDKKSCDEPHDWHAWMLRAWHLAILRFAVTLDNADKLGVFAIAVEIDRLGERCGEQRQFGFFRKKSADLCAAIPRQSQTAEATLRQYLADIDDVRLKRVFAAAMAIEQPDTLATKRHPKPGNKLWRGLPSRGDVRL
jgi:hypothetical protein